MHNESICLIWSGPLGCSADVTASIYVAILILMFLLSELERIEMLCVPKNRAPS